MVIGRDIHAPWTGTAVNHLTIRRDGTWFLNESTVHGDIPFDKIGTILGSVTCVLEGPKNKFHSIGSGTAQQLCTDVDYIFTTQNGVITDFMVRAYTRGINISNCQVQHMGNIL